MTTSSPTVEHEKRRDAHAKDVEALEGRATRLGLARLVLFLAFVILGGSAWSRHDALLGAGAGAALVAFVVLVVWHSRVLGRRDEAEARRAVHERHLLRLAGRSSELPPAGHAAPEHAYAVDIDLVGPTSLQQRIDVTHTARGEAILSDWLGAPASPEVIRERQAAVAELAPMADLRESLEALAGPADVRLDAAPFLEFTKRSRLVSAPLVALIHVMPLTVLGLFVAAKMGVLPDRAWASVLAVQTIVAFAFKKQCTDAFQLVAARRGYAEAFQRLLVTVEQARFDSAALKRLQERVRVEGRLPSQYMARLDRWAGLAEFYTQFPIHFVVDLMTLWDLHVLHRLERWNADVGKGLEDAFEALGELEALCSFAAVLADDPNASLPELHEDAVRFEAEELAHPLLPAERRVANDVTLPGRESAALVITGSNMAGKSTLLRAVGANLALALAGGPVIAKRFVFSPVRIRASMRVDDSLQRGASYFHAELTKLRTVVADAEAQPPIFFLLDEMLRGTNARARHLGARAILEHLLARGAVGLAATHDVALASLEEETDGRVRNVHFTDVLLDGEMVFDYRLRDGVVRTSNALRLLQLAGIDLREVDDRVTDG
ncbi:MAG: DNA mismatch repair protein MutS [Sandaracinus sp.]|nr:DNA mismatch repair protein MutS [Sandaracinus sp.]